MSIIQKKELQADGLYRISKYDDETLTLIHRWFEDKDGQKDGAEVEYYRTGRKIKECHYKNGKFDGDYKEYDRVGQILKECHYIDGELDGDYKEYNETGQIIKECHYIDGELDGDYKEYNETGQIIKECHYKNGTFDGDYKEYNKKEGYIIKKCHYIDGELDGDYLEIKETAAGKTVHVIQCEYKKGKLDGHYKERDGDGHTIKECNYIDGTCDRYYKASFTGGIVCKGYYNKEHQRDGDYEEYNGWDDTQTNWEYKEGKRHGFCKKVRKVYIEKDVFGNLEYSHDILLKKCYYMNDVLNGPYLEFDEEKNITKSCYYNDGKLYGEYTEYAGQLGHVIKRCDYINDVLDGKYIEYYAGGSIIKYEGSYRNGKKDGTWKTYATNGELIITQHFKNGKNVTRHYERLKKIAAKRIQKEKEIEDKTGKKTRLPKMSKVEKAFARFGIFKTTREQ